MLKGDILTHEALSYMAGLVRETTKIKDGIDDLNIRTDGTYSSKKITDLLNTLEYDMQTYINSSIGSMNHLKKEIVSTVPSASSAKENTIYLVQDANGGYDQYLLINGMI